MPKAIPLGLQWKVDPFGYITSGCSVYTYSTQSEALEVWAVGQPEGDNQVWM